MEWEKCSSQSVSRDCWLKMYSRALCMLVSLSDLKYLSIIIQSMDFNITVVHETMRKGRVFVCGTNGKKTVCYNMVRC